MNTYEDDSPPRGVGWATKESERAMKLLVAYYDLGHGRHGRDRLREHAIDSITGKALCGARMNDEDKLLWKTIDSKPNRLCSRCAELTREPTDAERLRAWNEAMSQ